MRGIIVLSLLLLCTLCLLTPALARFDDSWRDDVIALQDQINTHREAGNTEEVHRLQDQLRAKIDEGRGSRGRRLNTDVDPETGLPSHYEEMMHERIRARHDDRRDRRRLDENDRYRGRSSSRRSRNMDSNVEVDTTGLSDERALYHMEKIGQKSTILTDKLSRFAQVFSSEEHDKFRQEVQEYLKLEKVVAGYLQQTSDEFNKAKKLNTKEKRLAQIERAKQAKNDRKNDEMAAREAARDKFLEIKKKMEEKIEAQKGNEL